MPLKPLAPTEVSITGNRSLTSVLFSRAQTGIKQIVHRPRRPLREIGFANGLQPRIKKILPRNAESRLYFDLDQIRAAMGFGSELAETTALPAHAGLVDELTQPFVGGNHRRASGGQSMTKHR